MICRAIPGLSAHCGWDFLADRAETEPDVASAIELMQWVTDHALPSGVLAEQVHPITGEPLSVSPLT
jgi:GH15 family glucan-1,4-alpha-glucosidase